MSAELTIRTAHQLLTCHSFFVRAPVIKEYYARKPTKNTKGAPPQEDESGKQDKSTRDTADSNNKASGSGSAQEGKLVDA